jgi:hypothetical protein
MFMVEAWTVWKIKQQMKKRRYYLTNYALEWCHHNVWQGFKLNYKSLCLQALCSAKENNGIYYGIRHKGCEAL